jgi:hypothetical protein
MSRPTVSSPISIDVGNRGEMPMKYVARLLLVSACLMAQPVAPSLADDKHYCGSVSVSPVIDSQDEWRFRIALNGDASPGKDTGSQSKVRVHTLLQVTFKSSNGSLGRKMYQSECKTSFGHFSLRGQGLKGTHHGEQIVAIEVKTAQCCSPLRQSLCLPLEPERVPEIACQ